MTREYIKTRLNKVSQVEAPSIDKTIADYHLELEFLWSLHHEPDIKQVENWRSWQ